MGMLIDGRFSQKEIGKRIGFSQPRVSQICKDMKEKFGYLDADGKPTRAGLRFRETIDEDEIGIYYTGD